MGIAVYFYLTRRPYIPTYVYKYPPQLYYSAYAICGIGILYLIRKPITELLKKCRMDGVFSFIGSHTLWMYFYHILLLTLISQPAMNGGLRFMLIFSGSLLLTWLHHLAFSKINNKTLHSIMIG